MPKFRKLQDGASKLHKFQDGARHLHALLLIAAYVLLAVKAFFQFSYGGDYTWYHLPNGLIRWGYTSFTPSPYIQLINSALPPLADWFQGLFVSMTGMVTASSGINITLFAFVILMTCLLYGKELSLRWLLTAFLAIPLFTIHVSSGYVDLFGACGIFLAFVSLRPMKTQLRPRKRGFWFPLLSFCMGIALATLSRYQTWPAASLLCLLALFQIWTSRTELQKKQLILSSVLVCGTLAIWPVRNLIKFGNPTYPYRAPFIGAWFPSAISMEELYVNQTPLHLQGKPQPYVFLYSVLELSRLKEAPTDLSWSIDAGKGGLESPHYRMGGWSVYTMLLLLLFWVLSLGRRCFEKEEVLFILGITLFTSLMSQSHELRYSLFIPMILSFMVVQGLKSVPSRWNYIFHILIFLSAVYVGHKVKLNRLNLQPFPEHVPMHIQEAWRAYENSDHQHPLCGSDNSESIFFTGPTLKEFPVIDLTADLRKKHCVNGFYRTEPSL